MKYLLTLSYVGTAYHGWQVQPNARTVQSTLQDAVETLFGARYPLTGCSRTDSGVHARMFCATLETDASAPQIPPARLPAALNRHLPADIAVHRAEVVADDFHARYQVKWKRYVYRILTAPTRDPFRAGQVWHLPKTLDIPAMQAAATVFLGTHDFAGFMASGSSVTDTVRTIYDFTVTRKDDVTELSVTADGFLYNMVRILTGTLIAVSDGKLTAADIPNLLTSRTRSAAGETAPPGGLSLDAVSYLPWNGEPTL